jgi:hypothetical protein
MNINKIIKYFVLCVLLNIDVNAQNLPPRRVGERALVVEERIVFGDNFQGFFFKNKKLFEVNEFETIFRTPIIFEGENAEYNILNTKLQLGIGSAANKDESFFIKKENGNFIGSLNSDKGYIILNNNNEENLFNYVLISPIGDPESAIENIKIPMIGFSLDEYKFSAITVDVDNDIFPDSNNNIYNSLARIINSQGDTAIIWDSNNDGENSGLDADFIRGKTGLRLVEAPNSIQNINGYQPGDVAYKQFGNNHYILFFTTNNAWSWYQINIGKFPWEN